MGSYATRQRIKPKSNTVRNSGGSQSWQDTVDLYGDDRETFDSEYRRRGTVESVFAALEKTYGDCARRRRPENRTMEIPIRATRYNVELAARSDVKDGRLTQDQIAALAA